MLNWLLCKKLICPEIDLGSSPKRSPLISNIVDIPLSHAEIFQVIYYDATQEYRSHYDGWLHNNSEKSNRCMKYGGQRIATALCYLNNVEQGGCTGFPRLNIEVPPEQGKLLIFHNVY